MGGRGSLDLGLLVDEGVFARVDDMVGRMVVDGMFEARVDDMVRLFGDVMSARVNDEWFVVVPWMDRLTLFPKPDVLLSTYQDHHAALSSLVFLMDCQVSVDRVDFLNRADFWGSSDKDSGKFKSVENRIRK